MEVSIVTMTMYELYIYMRKLNKDKVSLVRAMQNITGNASERWEEDVQTEQGRSIVLTTLYKKYEVVQEVLRILGEQNITIDMPNYTKEKGILDTIN